MLLYTCPFLHAALSMLVSTCHSLNSTLCWFLLDSIYILFSTCQSQNGTLNVSRSTSQYKHAALFMQVCTCQSLHTTLCMPLPTCHSLNAKLYRSVVNTRGQAQGEKHVTLRCTVHQSSMPHLTRRPSSLTGWQSLVFCKTDVSRICPTFGRFVAAHAQTNRHVTSRCLYPLLLTVARPWGCNPWTQSSFTIKFNSLT